jgi:hypothetical protein
MDLAVAVLQKNSMGVNESSGAVLEQTNKGLAT